MEVEKGSWKKQVKEVKKSRKTVAKYAAKKLQKI